eukprot:6991730-Prymnesium_polylepis.1
MAPCVAPCVGRPGACFPMDPHASHRHPHTPGNSCAATEGSDAEKSGIACLRSPSAVRWPVTHGHAPRVSLGGGVEVKRQAVLRPNGRAPGPRPPRRVPDDGIQRIVEPEA